jgi:hypothetical protein
MAEPLALFLIIPIVLPSLVIMLGEYLDRRRTAPARIRRR